MTCVPIVSFWVLLTQFGPLDLWPHHEGVHWPLAFGIPLKVLPFWCHLFARGDLLTFLLQVGIVTNTASALKFWKKKSPSKVECVVDKVLSSHCKKKNKQQKKQQQQKAQKTPPKNPNKTNNKGGYKNWKQLKIHSLCIWWLLHKCTRMHGEDNFKQKRKEWILRTKDKNEEKQGKQTILTIDFNFSDNS